MADVRNQPKPEAPKQQTPVETKGEASGRASESSDPAVQHLLARRQTHAMNGQDDEVKAVDKELVELGFTEYK